MSAPYHSKALPEGTVLREWRLEEVLGVGGFGIVYRGKNVHFGDTVAIKEYFPSSISDRIDGTTVTPTDSSSEEVYTLGRQKFMEEAKILWNLSRPERHPNLVAVRSLFEIHGTAYMVMDFESGVSLSQMLRDGKIFDEQSLMALFRPVAEGLDKAHRAGVLHRDIKPANILVNPEGRPILIDFGSARFESNQATNTKVTFYTPPYAAIEQYVKSYPQGPWTDIYALAVMLYQCVTGDKPAEVLERMHGDDKNILSTREWPRFSQTFTRAVDAGMAIRPLERPANISAWLKMFDAKKPVVSDEMTRIAVASPPPVPNPQPEQISLPPETMPEPVKTDPVAPPPMASRTPEPLPERVTVASTIPPHLLQTPPKRTSRLALIGAGAVAVFAILAGVGVFISHWGKTADTAPLPIAVAAARPGTADLAAKMDAVIETAKKAGRRESEITALTAARTKLADLTTAKASSDELAAAATDMAKTENELLLRAERRMWRDVETPDAAPAGTGADVTQLQQAKTALDARLAAPPASDAVQIVDGVQLSLAGFAAFQDAYTAAMPTYIAAKRKSFDTLNIAARAMCDQVAKLAAVEKPWFLASSTRKAAYKTRQDNAASAKTIAARLDALAKMVTASNDLHQLAAAITEAGTAQKTATALVATSTAASVD